MTISTLLLILALVCFIFGALPPREWVRVNLIALGLAFWVGAVLIGGGALTIH